MTERHRLYPLPDGRHIAVGPLAGLAQLDRARADVDQFESAVILEASALSDHHAQTEQELLVLRRRCERLEAERDQRLTTETAPHGQPETGAGPAAKAPHRVRILWHKPFHVPDCEVTHPDACNALPYGEECWFDAATDAVIGSYLMEKWPDIGLYMASPAEGEEEHEVRFTPIPEDG